MKHIITTAVRTDRLAWSVQLDSGSAAEFVSHIPNFYVIEENQPEKKLSAESQATYVIGLSYKKLRYK